MPSPGPPPDGACSPSSSPSLGQPPQHPAASPRPGQAHATTTSGHLAISENPPEPIQAAQVSEQPWLRQLARHLPHKKGHRLAARATGAPAPLALPWP